MHRIPSLALCITLVQALSAVVPAQAQQPGTVLSHQKISDTQGGFTGTLEDENLFGFSVTSLGDLDGDGVGDLAVGAVGAFLDFDGGSGRGAVWILFLNTDGTVKSHQKISDTEGGFTGILESGDNFGVSVVSLGDLDGDGVGDLAVGALGDDDEGLDSGAVWVLFLNTDGTVKSHQKISPTDLLDDGDWFGVSVALLGDLDGDGVGDLAVGAFNDDDGGENRGAVWILFLNTDGTVKSHQKISDTQGGFTGILDEIDRFGISVASLGDLDGDGMDDLAVGASSDDDGGDGRGTVWVLFLNTDGTVKFHQKISDTQGSFTGILDDFDNFGRSVASVGDLDGDAVGDLAVGANFDDDGGSDRGAMWVLFLHTDGTVKSHQKISDTQGGFTGILDNDDRFGTSVGSLGDLDGDGVGDLAVGVRHDDDGGENRGAVWVLFLDGVPAECDDDADCGDTLFCNGDETCVNGVCQPGSDPCPGQCCDEANDTCGQGSACASNADCDNGDFCDGEEQCIGECCQAGSPPCAGGDCCDDTDACGPCETPCNDACGNGTCEPRCDEDSCTCPVDCGSSCGDGCCNGTEAIDTCPTDCACTFDDECGSCEECQSGACESKCDDDEFCVDGVCKDCLADTDCPGEMMCDAGNECVECLVDSDCDDGIACTVDRCNNGECDNTQTTCAAGQECDGDTGICVGQEDPGGCGCGQGSSPMMGAIMFFGLLFMRHRISSRRRRSRTLRI